MPDAILGHFSRAKVQTINPQIKIFVVANKGLYCKLLKSMWAYQQLLLGVATSDV